MAGAEQEQFFRIMNYLIAGFVIGIVTGVISYMIFYLFGYSSAWLTIVIFFVLLALYITFREVGEKK